MFPKKPKDKKLIYLDHASTTYLDLEVKKGLVQEKILFLSPLTSPVSS